MQRCLEVSLSSPAKLNVGLKIIGRDERNYHLLQSVFWPISLTDRIHLEIGEFSERSCTALWAKNFPDVALPQNTENTVYHVLDAALASEGSNLGFRVQLTKAIPMGAGLGGSSSNAGAVLGELVRQGLLPLDSAFEIGTRFGADIPFFIQPEVSWAEGIGDLQSPVNIPSALPVFFLILVPDKALSTPQVYDVFRKSNAPFSKPLSRQKTWNNQNDLRDYLKVASNDLEQAAISLLPQLAEVLDALDTLQPDFSGMTGSGSACFGMFFSEEKRVESAKALESFCRTFPCKLIAAQTWRPSNYLGEQHGNHGSKSFSGE